MTKHFGISISPKPGGKWHTVLVVDDELFIRMDV